MVLGPAVPISRRSRMGVPLGVRTNLSRALRTGRFDVVHGFEPALPSLSYLALREAESLTVATFLSPERLAYPPGRAQREKLLGRIDVLLATSQEMATRRRLRFPGDYRIVLGGRRHVAVRADAQGAADRARVAPDRAASAPRRPPHARRASRLAAHSPADEAAVDAAVHPADALDRVDVRSARDAPSRAAILNEAAIFVPATHGLSRLALEAKASGAAVAAPPGTLEQPQLATAEMGRLAEDDSYREQSARESARVRGGPDVHRRRARARRDLREPARPPADAEAGRRPAVGSRLDRRRPPHAHERVARLPRPSRAPARPRGGGRARRDRDHGPQRLLRRPRGRRARTRPRHPRDSRRGGEDRRPGRGDRPLPARGDPARDELRRDDRGDQGAGRHRLRPASVRPHARDPRRRDAPPPPRRDRRVRGVQRAAALRDLQRRGAALRAQVQPDHGRGLRRARPPGRGHRRAQDARIRGAGASSCSASAPPRSCAGPSRFSTSSP